MANGDIEYATFPLSADSTADFDALLRLDAIFPVAEYEILTSELIPISGGSGITTGVCIVVARRIV